MSNYFNCKSWKWMIISILICIPLTVNSIASQSKPVSSSSTNNHNIPSIRPHATSIVVVPNNEEEQQEEQQGRHHDSSTRTTSITSTRIRGRHNLLPTDVLYHKPTKMALQALRDQYEQYHQYHTQIDQERSTIKKLAIESLYNQQICNDHGITLTLKGYKGAGDEQDQINQDRAFIHSPFTLSPLTFVNNDINNRHHDNANDINHHRVDEDEGKNKDLMQLMGVMDGHGHLGEDVSEYCASMIPKLLNEKLMKLQITKKKNRGNNYSDSEPNNANGNANDINNNDHTFSNNHEALEYCALKIPNIMKLQIKCDDKNLSNYSHDDDNDNARRHHTGFLNGHHDEALELPINKPSSSVSMENILKDIFLTINATVPDAHYGGCTASILFRMNNQVYIANAGDSRTFLFSYQDDGSTTPNDDSDDEPTSDDITENLNIKMIYESREHKPYLEEEKNRIEECGGMVYIPPELTEEDIELGHELLESSRVVVANEEEGYQLALAISRSLGDWFFSNYGVTAEPTVDVIDLDKIVSSSSSSKQSNNDDSNIKIFAVSASDGLLDYVTPKDIGEILATSFSESDGIDIDEMDHSDEKGEINQNMNMLHTSTAVEELIFRAAQGWYDEMGPSYRDDIAVAAMRIIT